MQTWRILLGDVREKLAELPADSVQCCVTSPPYWGLRDYGHAGQIGLEPTPDAYVRTMVEVFRGVWRVLKNDGTCWINLGDSYARNGGTQGGGNRELLHMEGRQRRMTTIPDISGLKPKDLVGIPWRVAFALQADGWYLRSDIIWSKPNPMPESVTDRPTKAHEYLFLLSKSQRYYYDQEAIVEDSIRAGDIPGGSRKVDVTPYAYHSPQHLGRAAELPVPDTRNRRSVWNITTQPYPEAHFATFPEALVEPCILAGSRPAGKRCDCDDVIETPIGSGSINDPSLIIGRAGMNRPRRPDEGTRPITRREQREYAEQMKASPFREQMATAAGEAFAHYIRTDKSGARPLPEHLLREWLSIGWLIAPAPCDCPIEPGDMVLDPFCGSGTTGAVAIRLGRSFVGVELNPAYVALAEKRIGNAAPLFASNSAEMLETIPESDAVDVVGDAARDRLTTREFDF